MAVKNTLRRLQQMSLSALYMSSRVSCLCFCFAAFLVTQLHAAPTRPAAITLGFLYNFVDPVYQYEGVQLYAGLKAAEKEINDGDILRGTTINIQYFAGLSNASSPAAQLANAQAALPGLFGFILSDYQGSKYLYEAAGGNNPVLPVVGARTLTEFEFQPPYSYATTMRQPPSTQYRVLLHSAMNDPTTQCSKFAVVAETEYFPNIFAEVTTTLVSMGYAAPVIISVSSQLDTAAVAQQWFQSSAAFPLCGLLFMTGRNIQALLYTFHQDARFPFSKMTFYANDFGRLQNFNHTTQGGAPYQRLRFVASFPDHRNPTLPISVAYRAALSAWLATNPTMPADLQVAPLNTEPNLNGLEGYMAGKMLGEILRDTTDITPQGFIDTMYRIRYFWIEDYILGPYFNRCLVGSIATFPCWCNVAVQDMYIIGVLPSGRIGTLSYPALDNNVYRISSPSDKCYLEDTNLLHPVAIDVFETPNLPPAGRVAFQHFYNLLRQQAASINAGSLPDMFLSVSMTDQITVIPTGESRAATMSKLYEQRRPTVVLGNWFSREDISADVVNILLQTTTNEVDLPLTAATRFSRNTWEFKPTIADLAHTLAAFLRERLFASGANPRVLIAASTPQSHSSLVKSFHTNQFPVEAGPSDANFSDVSAVQQLLHNALSVAASGVDTVLALATTNSNVKPIIDAAIAEIAVWDVLSSGPVAFAHFTLMLACDSSALGNAKPLLDASSIATLSHIPIYFGTPLPAHFEPQNSFRLALSELLNTTSNQLLESNAFHTGMIVMELLTNTLRKVTKARPLASDLLDVIYGNVVNFAAGVTIGPMYDANCSADVIASGTARRTCQCFKAIRTVNVLDYRGWLQNDASYNPSYAYTLPGCGVEYSPLLIPASLNVGMIAGIAAPCGTALLAAVIYFACCFGRRNNRAAPKDPDAPFAMVFTDIQSSTSLWARAPEQMGDALEQHHELLRKLVSRHDGYEVKTIGDSFMVAFVRASDAAAFALDIQGTLFAAEWPPEIDDVYVALAQEAYEEMLMTEDPKKAQERDAAKTRGDQPALQQWEDVVNYPLNWNGIRVRVGLHWGLGSVKLDPVSQGYDYYGTLVNTAARVEGVGNGGQVLATKDLFDRLEVENFDFSNVDVKPLGPQPLRGLDQPVPLFQLSPVALQSRQFNALRLDVEVDLDDTEDSYTASKATGDDKTATSAFSDTPDGLIDRLLKRQKEPAVLRDYFLRVVHLMETMLRTSPMSWRKDTVKTLMKKWHVHQRKPRDAKEPAEQTMTYDLITLIVRVGLAAEEARKANWRGEDVSRNSNSRSSSAAPVRRKQSLRRTSNSVVAMDI